MHWVIVDVVGVGVIVSVGGWFGTGLVLDFEGCVVVMIVDSVKNIIIN
jgi:hypothetical protein